VNNPSNSFGMGDNSSGSAFTVDKHLMDSSVSVEPVRESGSPIT